jgi:hypothetical protein
MILLTPKTHDVLTCCDRYNGMNYSLSIFIADTSSLKNRSFMFAFSSSPDMDRRPAGNSLPQQPRRFPLGLRRLRDD